MDAVFTSEVVFDANSIGPIGIQNTKERRDRESAQSISSNESEERDKLGQWSEIPSLPLENIYSFLRREDQVNMSLVCRSWSDGYGSPSVWKTFRFDLTESHLSMDSCPVMEVVKKYSSMFRHVEIVGSCVQNCLMKNFCRLLVEFLHILKRNTQLISVKFLYSVNYIWRIDTQTYDDICREITDFLASQRHLKRVEFNVCFFYFQECVEILRKLTENSKESLTHLKLKNFLRYEHKDFKYYSNAARKLPMLADLPSLKTLETDYSFILENLVARQSAAIQTVKKCQTLVLSKLILHYFNEYTKIEDFRGLTSTDWRFIKRLYPDLQVELILTIDNAARRVFEFIISPNMPISRLEYSSVGFNAGTEIPALFDHLLACQTNEHFVTLHLDWEEPSQNLSSTFIPFLQACKKLKCLELFTISPISGVDVLLKSWLENRPESLEKVIIDVSNVHEEDDFPGWINITDYAFLLKLVGLNIMFLEVEFLHSFSVILIVFDLVTNIFVAGRLKISSDLLSQLARNGSYLGETQWKMVCLSLSLCRNKTSKNFGRVRFAIHLKNLQTRFDRVTVIYGLLPSDGGCEKIQQHVPTRRNQDMSHSK
ncbi:hypothetical protein AVEN_127527-1 [Araneus ventricosus]|uniref:F-box domain-containing protein n=1 Tax=Araneus ventricosus TaxID=182803 RepID=A0A4Y2T645_ARAVE|nr:hypothetical protein AVEN_34180-1 [Araneus ventricosus]GBN95263.1 hypothetical protein AVEN_127527-1 [Araneus ventricosus]